MYSIIIMEYLHINSRYSHVYSLANRMRNTLTCCQVIGLIACIFPYSVRSKMVYIFSTHSIYHSFIHTFISQSSIIATSDFVAHIHYLNISNISVDYGYCAYGNQTTGAHSHSFQEEPIELILRSEVRFFDL